MLPENQVGVIMMEPVEAKGEKYYLASGRLDFLSGEQVSRWDGAAGRS